MLFFMNFIRFLGIRKRPVGLFLCSQVILA